MPTNSQIRAVPRSTSLSALDAIVVDLVKVTVKLGLQVITFVLVGPDVGF
jgi:hypothetical protein